MRTDDLILNSMMRNHEENPDSLLKAMNKAGLVQKEVQVKGKNGQVFTRKQWVRASEDQPSQKPAGKQDEKNTASSKNQQSNHFTGKNMSELLSSLKNSGYEMDGADQHSPQDTVTLYKDKKEFTATFNKYSDGGVEVLNIKPAAGGSSSDGGDGSDGNKGKTVKQSQWKTPSSKQDLVQLLQSGASREDIMAQAEKDGITWKKSENPGINWMRASMAITGTTTKGDKEKTEKQSKSSEKQENKSKKTEEDALNSLREMDGWEEDGLAMGTNDDDVFYAINHDDVDEEHKLFVKTTYGAMVMGDEVEDGKQMTAQEVLAEVSKKFKEKKTEAKRTSSVKLKSGAIDKQGDLVVSDKSELGDLVEEITGKDMFDLRDAALDDVESRVQEYNHLDGYYIESMAVDSAKVVGDKVQVTAKVDVRLDFTDGDSDSDNMTVSFELPLKRSVSQKLNS